MQIELEGRAAIVTGASRGIGLAIARRLAEAGCSVMLVSRKPEGLAEAAASLEGLAGAVAWKAAHVAHRDDAEAAIAACLASFGRIDVLVNNAGTNPYFGPLMDIDEARVAKTIEINQTPPLLWTQLCWEAWMRDHGGAILNISSIGGLGPEPNIGWYNVTKAALIHLTSQLAYELAPGVRVNGIAPGLVKTDLARALWEPHEVRIAAAIPLKRLGEPDDIATAALFLLSDEASWITGQTMVVDGGTTNQPTGGVG